jgi:putative inorganic carbon (HCO3(-)) transporter
MSQKDSERSNWRVPPGPSEDRANLTADHLALRPSVLWKSFRAEGAAFIAICIYLVLEYVKPEQAYPIFGILPFLRLSLIVAIIAAFTDPFARLRGGWLAALTVFFLLHCVVSASFAYDSSYSWDKFSIVGLWVLVFLLISAIVSTERRVFLFFVFFVIANFKMSQFGFFSWVKRGFGFASYGLTGSGWYHNSGEFGLQMSVFFAYLACLIRTLRDDWSKWTRRLMYFMALSAASCVIASNSRGAILSALAVILYLVLTSEKRFKAWFATAIFLCLGFFMMPDQFLARFHTAGQDATSLSRQFYWEKAKLMMHEHPWTGVGYYNWVPYFRDHYFDPSLYWRIEEAHNTYLQVGAELGYTGLILFSAMVIVSFIVNLRTARQARRHGFRFLYALSVGMNAACLGLVVGSMFLTAFFLPNYWIHFALTVCLATATRRKMEAAGKAPVLVTAPPGTISA